MWSNYDLVIAKQVHADQIASVGYRIPAAAKREVSEEALALHLAKQRQVVQKQTQAAARTAIVSFMSAIKVLFRSRTILAR